MTWAGKRVVVTGAAGFIGSHLAERLAELGARTRAFVHYRSVGGVGWLRGSPAAKDIEVVAGDIGDPDSVRRALEGAEVAFHLAALIGIPYSYDAPRSYVRTNVEGTLNVLRAAQHTGLGRLVHTSTSEVYGTARTVPMDEQHPLQAQSPYAATKIAADKLVEAFHASFGLEAVTVRPFNVYGPRQSRRAIVPTIISQCLRGQTVRLGNLDPTRDMNFVTDTVEAFVLAGASPQVSGDTLNVGTGREVSIGALAALIATLMGVEVTIEQEQRRTRPSGSEVERLVARSDRLQALTGWRPRRSLEEGLELTIEWWRREARLHGGHGTDYAV